MAVGAPATLLVLYVLTGAWLFSRLAVLVSQGHRVLHYAVFFHGAAALWMLARVLWWALAVAGVDVGLVAGDLLFWLPHVAMFVTFSILALFLLKLTGRKMWWTARVRARLLVAFATLACLNVVATVTLALLDSDDSDGDAAVQTAESSMTAFLFLLLAGLFA